MREIKRLSDKKTKKMILETIKLIIAIIITVIAVGFAEK